MEKDPACGMMVDPKTAEYKSTYQGKTYFFCSPGCKKDFEKGPDHISQNALLSAGLLYFWQYEQICLGQP
jgi:YHS domain-containing protein